MHGARGALHAGAEVRGGREVRPQGPEALSDEEGRGYVNTQSLYIRSVELLARLCGIEFQTVDFALITCIWSKIFIL